MVLFASILRSYLLAQQLVEFHLANFTIQLQIQVLFVRRATESVVARNLACYFVAKAHTILSKAFAHNNKYKIKS